MPKQFYQCDVAESDSDSIWTSSVFYCETSQEAEFLTMLALQSDWGDSYVGEAFVDAFGSSEDEYAKAPFPGAEAWDAGGHWDDAFKYSEVTASMLTVAPAEALAKLGKIDAPSAELIEAAMSGATLRLSIASTEGR
jgi:hypothetical protein